MVITSDIFSITLTLIMNFFSCSPQNTSFYIGKKHELDFQGILNTLRCDMVTSFQHFHDVTDGRAAVHFLSSHKAGTRM